jgi:hypothetical protein
MWRRRRKNATIKPPTIKNNAICIVLLDEAPVAGNVDGVAETFNPSDA